MDYGFLATWSDFLPREAGHLLAIAGHGDRALVLDSLAGFYASMGLDAYISRVPEGDSFAGTAEEMAGIYIHEVEEKSHLPLGLIGREGIAWPANTTLAFVVLGGEGVGDQAGAVLGQLDAAGAGPGSLARLDPHDLVTWEHLAELLLNDGGYLDHIPPSLPVVLGITGLEEIADSIGLFGFLGRVMENPRLPLVLFCGRGDDSPSLRTAYRLERGETIV